MKRIFLKSVAACALALLSSHVMATEGGTAAEATAMVKKAIAYQKANGPDKTFAEIQNPGGAFRDRDLYVSVIDMSGKYYAQGANPKMVGKNLIDLKDVDGKFIIKSIIEVASTKGSGWVDYKWANPSSGAIEQKSSYVEKSGELMYVTGIYKH